MALLRPRVRVRVQAQAQEFDPQEVPALGLEELQQEQDGEEQQKLEGLRMDWYAVVEEALKVQRRNWQREWKGIESADADADAGADFALK